MSAASTEPYYFQGLIVQPDCQFCPLRGSKMVLPDGPYPARMCVVGEGPGAEEERLGQGFVGASGEAQWEMCWNGGDGGFTRDRVWVSNSALCLPRAVTLPGHVKISKEQAKFMSVKACRRRLIGELLSVTQGDPDAVIVAVGALAFQSLTGNWHAKIHDYRGSINPVDLKDLWEELNR